MRTRTVQPLISASALGTLTVCAARWAVPAAGGGPLAEAVLAVCAARCRQLSEHDRRAIGLVFDGAGDVAPAAGRLAAALAGEPVTPLPLPAGYSELDLLAVGAVRYAAGRRTYITGTVSAIVAAAGTQLSAAARQLIVEQLRAADGAGQLGDVCDVQAWRELRAALER